MNGTLLGKQESIQRNGRLQIDFEEHFTRMVWWAILSFGVF